MPGRHNPSTRRLLLHCRAQIWMQFDRQAHCLILAHSTASRNGAGIFHRRLNKPLAQRLPSTCDAADLESLALIPAISDICGLRLRRIMPLALIPSTEHRPPVANRTAVSIAPSVCLEKVEEFLRGDSQTAGLAVCPHLIKGRRARSSAPVKTRSKPRPQP